MADVMSREEREELRSIRRAQEDARRAALRFALASRLLSADEMREVERLGEELCEPDDGDSFREDEVREHFLALMAQQFRLRKIAESITPSTAPSMAFEFWFGHLLRWEPKGRRYAQEVCLRCGHMGATACKPAAPPPPPPPPAWRNTNDPVLDI